MATINLGKKRKNVWKRSPVPIKRRKISANKWFKRKNQTQSMTKNVSKPSDPIDDNDTFEIVKISKPRYPTNESHNESVSSTPLKIKLATPSKGKHTEYNLQSLQEAVIEMNNDKMQNNESSDDETEDTEGNKPNDSINIKTRNEIISTQSEWHTLCDPDSENKINEHLLGQITKFMKLSHPTLIQKKSIPHLLSFNDLLIKSETGSGKTLAFLIPIVSDLMKDVNVRSDGTKAMIIAPTRELSIQIFNVCNVLCRAIPFIVVGHIMGGEDKKKEKSRIRKGLTICIGTPGICFVFDAIINIDL